MVIVDMFKTFTLVLVFFGVSSCGRLFETQQSDFVPLRRRMQSSTVNEHANSVIPKTLWFIHNSNILETKEPAEYYDNVINTITTYIYSWGELHATAHVLDYEICSERVADVSPYLVQHFESERVLAYKAAMCRAATLYHHGGYYFDTQVRVITPYHPSDGTTLVGAIAQDGEQITPTFLASVARHSILRQTLDEILHIYHNSLDNFMLGAVTLSNAYQNVGDSGVHLLEEIQLDTTPEKTIYEHVARQEGRGFCNNVIHDPLSQTVHFFSHFEGSTSCHMSKSDAKESDVVGEVSQSTAVSSSVKAEESSFEEQQQSMIPQQMWFTYKNNLLETKTPRSYYDNVLNTIQAYKDAWGNPNAFVLFLNDDACRLIIKDAYPRLLPYFNIELVGAYKADICRAAAVYLHGGYYFDVDLQVVEPVIPRAESNFVSITACSGACFFQAFFASIPDHPLLEMSLDSMLHTYLNKMSTDMLGPISMSKAYFTLAEGGQEKDVELLEELLLDVGPHPEHYPGVPRQRGTGNCNYIAHDPVAQKIFFFARFVGYGGCTPLDS